jgi:hypothetical protein
MVRKRDGLKAPDGVWTSAHDLHTLSLWKTRAID